MMLIESTDSDDEQQFDKNSLLPLATDPKNIHSLRRADAIIIWNSYASAPDRLLETLYQYYRGAGLQTLILNRSVNLGILLFMHSFILFLIYGIDWRVVDMNKKATWNEYFCSGPWCLMQRMGIFGWIGTLVFLAGWGWAAAQLLMVDMVRWREAKVIYRYLFDIRDRQLSRLEFDTVLKKIEQVNKGSSLVNNMDSVQICARVMRRENYMIALFNKGLLNFEIENESNAKKFVKIPLSKPLEWALTFTILGYVFDENFMVKKRFLARNPGDNGHLIEGLRRRILITGLVSLVLSPLIFLFTLCYIVFRYGEEIYRNPSCVSSRQYTPSARWLFREYNELPHYFEKRLSLTHKKASKYIDQFHGARLSSIARLVSFTAGCLFLLLVYLSIRNEELIIHLELPFGKSILWYLGILGALLATARSLQPDESRRDDPARLLTQVIEYLHYRPVHWTDLSSKHCHMDFSRLFKYKLQILFDDLLGTLSTPLVFLYILPHRTDQLVDFFREFTIHVDNLGYVCSFSLFDFTTNADNMNIRSGTNEKMSMSMASFAGRHIAKPPHVDSEVILEEEDYDEDLPEHSVLTQFYK